MARSASGEMGVGVATAKKRLVPGKPRKETPAGMPLTVSSCRPEPRRPCCVSTSVLPSGATRNSVTKAAPVSS